jgi:hypothetical protein
MKKSILKLAMLCSLVTVSCFGSSSAALAGDAPKLQNVAIVSLSVSDVGGSVQGGSIGSTPVSKLISDAVNTMVDDAEKKLGAK